MTCPKIPKSLNQQLGNLFHVHTVHVDNYQCFFSPTDAQLVNLNDNLMQI